ncbi:DUF3108 domain-containing protein [Phyllobacterium sp. P30BS-XVII]|uniref:DUF3108 domain-containing protein n=1 Tax=Phyllobacterium sp. P30BS-XVII TaxID=2587046 RepID=UPI000DD7025E|nr:DUF3108 domain-containing protein [Phyllobacterium sp. P30BS-XVII]MBA8900270.1 hypothetical protein [Phyllobacterium sp. P30BS-XVII]
MTGPIQRPGYGKTVLAAASLLAILCAAPASAEESYKSDYRVSLLGLTIAKSYFTTRVADGAYEVSGSLRSSGLVTVFDDTKGTIDVKGQFTKTGAVPNSYVVKYRHGKKDKSTSIAFAKGNVTETTNVPPVQKKDKWVELAPESLLGAADPISGVMVAADSIGQVCTQTLHLYDGQTRVDLKLSPVGAPQPFSTKGFKGDAVTCSVKFIPIGGYRQGRDAIEYLKNKSKISLTFASLGKSGIYSPVQAKISTQIGTVTVYATRFEKMQ